jgi:hypothetical protein
LDNVRAGLENHLPRWAERLLWLAALFGSGAEAVRLIQLHEIYGRLEGILVLMEECAEEIEAAALKRFH